MCKFNQNLFIVWCSLWLVLLFKTYNASPLDFMLLDDLIDEPGNEPDHDLTYDQRQNGTENIRLNIDGVIIAFPSSSSSQASNAAGSLATNYLLQLAAGAADDDDDSDYFPFVKNANNENGVTAPSAASEKETAEQAKDKKKITSIPEPTKDNSVKRVVIVKEAVKNEAVAVPPQHVDPVVDEQSNLDVVPVKKIQSRRKNKHKLRLAGLLDFLERYREQN
ncbi:uncharacterized protein LOC129565473 [Sitodiplosis mosellana]|uniref:uncharacterized protein LOC129565473 n=1 Tax=Sitodiplosis mosellana TaxID=263140 RepID=UPI002444895F|nr:uncharacterized protein LOC129565473 [Sitodiplosis mosellana]